MKYKCPSTMRRCTSSIPQVQDYMYKASQAMFLESSIYYAVGTTLLLNQFMTSSKMREKYAAPVFNEYLFKDCMGW